MSDNRVNRDLYNDCMKALEDKEFFEREERIALAKVTGAWSYNQPVDAAHLERASAAIARWKSARP